MPETVAVTARAAVLVVFLVAFVSKVRSRKDFAEFRESVRTMAPAWVPPAAVVVLEALVPILVAVPETASVGLTLAAVLLAAFSAAAVAARLRGRRAICRCFGAAQPFGPAHYVRNGVLGAVAVAGAFAAGGPSGGFSAMAPAAATGVAMAVLLLALDDLVPLLARTPAGDVP